MQPIDLEAESERIILSAINKEILMYEEMIADLKIAGIAPARMMSRLDRLRIQRREVLRAIEERWAEETERVKLVQSMFLEEVVFTGKKTVVVNQKPKRKWYYLWLR